MLYKAMQYYMCCARVKPSVHVSNEAGLLTQTAEEIKEHFFEDVRPSAESRRMKELTRYIVLAPK